jgi:elongation factor P
MISTNQFKNGTHIDVEGTIYKIVEFQHVKPGKGPAFVRTKLKRTTDGNVIDKTFRAGEKFRPVRTETRKMQFLYKDGADAHFMDSETYDQFSVPAALLGDDAKFLVENTEVFVSNHDNEILGVDLPVTVDLRVTQTDPGFAGDTAAGAKKAATVQTGLVVQVPLFVNEGDVLRVDTRTGEYVTRVQ